MTDRDDTEMPRYTTPVGLRCPDCGGKIDVTGVGRDDSGRHDGERWSCAICPNEWHYPTETVDVSFAVVADE